MKIGTKSTIAMKKSFYIITAAVLSLVACSRNQEVDVLDANLSLFARPESPAETKTVVESGVHVYWEPGDEIAVFTGEQSAKFTTEIMAASGTATFKGTFGDATWPEDLDLWAVYPFSEDAVFDGETITTTLPSEQVAREGSFGKDMNLAIAHSSGTTLQFYNVGGGIRFSITEEGIKKVMFEGLSGEIISGKVKIGFEDGLPVVKEVTGGSQFVTLLPPDGSETFEPGAWYYIVAIPGSLDGGYKLRFYKDTDYARKVSVKAVVIKRSIFGNLEKADSGIDFEPQTTHFPVTEEEWEASVALTEVTSDVIGQMVESYVNSMGDIDALIEDASNVESILDVRINSDKSALMVRQKDSVWINYLLFDSSLLLRQTSSQSTNVRNTSDRSNSVERSITSRRKIAQSFLENEAINKKNAYISKSEKALILAPFQEEFGEPLSYWESILKTRFSEVIVLPNETAAISCFGDDYLSQFDFILIDTHGVIGYYAYENGILDGITFQGYGLTTGTRYSAKEVKRLIDEGFFGPEDLFVTWHDWKRYFCMTPRSLKKKTLDNPVVILSACQSAYRMYDYTDEDAKESMIGAFLNNGARQVTGTRIDVYSGSNRIFDEMVIQFMCHGLSLHDAHNYILHSEKTLQAINEYYRFFPDTEYASWNIPVNYTIGYNKYTSTQPHYFLLNPFPTNLKEDTSSNSVKFTWDSALNSFSIPWYHRLNNDGNWETKEYRYDVRWDLYVKGELVAPDLILTQSRWTVPDVGDYTWFVVAKIMEGNTVLASYQSEEKSFTVKEQIPDPPQVETFPASVDAQKAFLSGMVTNRSLEGLETGFYYYKLTAQEGSTELSASEKERLVMGGKKVLSAGDYKDYFGIDLTDIEQDSKYLFVAYATDEYSQTGKGEVLSFTTGSPSVHVSSVSLNMSSLELGVGNTATLVATVLPENASNKKVIWSSSDESRATVSSQGVVKGISMGNAVITATTEDGGKTAQCHVSVTQSAVHVQSVSLNKTDLVLTVGNSETLVATVLPENAANKSVTWSSSNPSKATVSSTGVVTGVAEGAAVVTATTVDGGKTASCFVTVRQAAQPDPGESGNALIELSCDELDWGDVEIGNNVTKTFTVKNTGTTALNISSVSIVATDNTVNPSYFSILPNSSSTVSPGNSLAFNVTFIPEAECGYYAIVSIKSNASNATQGTSTVWLTGVGIKSSSSHSVATPEIVDLGLPSGIKWASFNLGASKPEEFGDYFAWGETEPYYEPGFAQSESPVWKPGKENGYYWSSYKWCMGIHSSITKYCINPSYGYNGFTDGKTLLDFEDDAAKVNLGDKWRIPTTAEMDELVYNCTWKWTSMNGISGYKVTGPNGNSIFLPAAGLRNEYGFHTGSGGYYWGANIETASISYDATYIYLDSSEYGWSYTLRCEGLSIRPVYGDHIPVASVFLDKSSLVFNVGETATLSPLILPNNAANKAVTWSSSNTSVATVSSSGVVTGVSCGSAIITVTTVDGGKTATCDVTITNSSSPNVPVPEIVDLGLSSGIKWASFNLGATKPEGLGDYYAWGETEPYYDILNPSTWIKGKEAGYAWYSYKWCMGSSYSLTKYCTDSSNGYNGFLDGKTILDPDDDAAHVNLGGNWRMPTWNECLELQEECTWEQTSINGVNGCIVIGPNGNSIFLPKAGKYSGKTLYWSNGMGEYWSSVLSSSTGAMTLEIDSSGSSKHAYYRYVGQSIRPVYDDK